MDINELITVCTVNETGNFSNSAYELSLSTSVISKHVKKVEEELGIIIFERANKSKQLSLTEDGKEVISFLQAMVNSYLCAKTRIDDIKKDRRNKLTIGYLPMVCSFKENEILMKFALDNPDILLYRKGDDTSGLIKMLLSGVADGVFIQMNEGADQFGGYFDSLAYPDIIVKEVLYNDSLMVGLPVTHPLAKEKLITRDKFKQFEDEVFLFSLEHLDLHPARTVDVIKNFLELEKPMKIRYVDFADPILPLAIVERGDGVLFQTGFTPERIGNVKFVPLEGADKRSYLYFVYKNSAVNRTLKKFIACVEEFSKEFHEKNKKQN